MFTQICVSIKITFKQQNLSLSLYIYVHIYFRVEGAREPRKTDHLREGKTF